MERNEIMAERRKELPEEVVDLTCSGWNSRLGRYFIGQTDELNLGNQLNAWGGIINPCLSGVNVYFDIFTITNFGDQSFHAEIWLNAVPINADTGLSTITSSNQSIYPLPRAKAFMAQADYMSNPLAGGVNIFNRIVTPNSTLVSDSHQGSIIIGPGGTFSILLKSQGGTMNSAMIVLTWWEERIGRR